MKKVGTLMTQEQGPNISAFAARKAARRDYLERHVYGWRQRPCSACSGSGYYDDDGSPPCGACGGSGKERYQGSKSPFFDKPSNDENRCNQEVRRKHEVR